MKLFDAIKGSEAGREPGKDTWDQRPLLFPDHAMKDDAFERYAGIHDRANEQALRTANFYKTLTFILAATSLAAGGWAGYATTRVDVVEKPMLIDSATGEKITHVAVVDDLPLVAYHAYLRDTIGRCLFGHSVDVAVNNVCAEFRDNSVDENAKKMVRAWRDEANKRSAIRNVTFFSASRPPVDGAAWQAKYLIEEFSEDYTPTIKYEMNLTATLEWRTNSYFFDGQSGIKVKALQFVPEPAK